jgi:predicted membrane metal-binding protein
VMGCMTLFILLPGRTVSIRRVLWYTRCGMLLYNPYYLFYDLWFTLSFGAVVGIIIVTDLYTKNRLESDDKNSLSQTVGPLIYVRQWYTYIISNYILPTIWAMIGTLPLLLYSMGKVNITALLINIGIVPLVPLITIMGFISPYVWWCWLDQSLLHLLDYILWLSQFGSDYWLFMVRNY